MASPIDTLGKAQRHGMLVKVQCPRCNHARLFRADELAFVFGAGRSFDNLPFRCRECMPPRATASPILHDTERDGSILLCRPLIKDGRCVGWYMERTK